MYTVLFEKSVSFLGYHSSIPEVFSQRGSEGIHANIFGSIAQAKLNNSTLSPPSFQVIEVSPDDKGLVLIIPLPFVSVCLKIWVSDFEYDDVIWIINAAVWICRPQSRHQCVMASLSPAHSCLFVDHFQNSLFKIAIIFSNFHYSQKQGYLKSHCSEVIGESKLEAMNATCCIIRIWNHSSNFSPAAVIVPGHTG